ncbi:fumarylacetoacetate hydrolase family protein [Streptomyces sp. NPDC057611]|uniref:fumarylacetoacetate hydrolase family protein n=1 Tax=Streptomyces sp. NPDC057611 TaxID=3346182 RepID=UPI00367CB179
MNLVRYHDDSGLPRVGVTGTGGIHPVDVPDMATLLRHRVTRIRELLDSARRRAPIDAGPLLAPIDGRTEVWGAGVTYLRSRAARMEESRHQLVYQDVYDADRPELFFKSAAWRVRTDGEPAGIRSDCTDTVPEPELALVLTAHAEIVGALVCNDFTARSVEAQNPIYLPQAKLYAGSCALSHQIVPWWTITRPDDLPVSIEVRRDGTAVFTGQARTSTMKRGYTELVDWLFRAEEFPDGAVLSTGTGAVPPLGEGLRTGDLVRVEIGQVGELTNVMTGVGA